MKHQTAILLDNIPSLWMLREGAIAAPHTRLAHIVALDERLEANLDALTIEGDHQGLCETESVILQEAGGPFTVARVKLYQGEMEKFARTIIGMGRQGEFELEKAGSHIASRGLNAAESEAVAALAWVQPRFAAPVIGRLAQDAEGVARAIAIAAIGARRSDPGPALFPALADPSPLVRARAYCTTGQLGRADLMAQLAPGLTDPDPECRFWSAWAAARMGAIEPLNILAEIAWNNLPRADRALDLLLRRLEVPHANAWLREFAKLPDRQRDLIRATGVVGDPAYIPWLIEHMAEPATARFAGEAFSMITGLDLAYRDLDRRPPADFQSGPNDDPADENVALDQDEHLPWPDPARIGPWWAANKARFSAGAAYFLGTPKQAADWLEALSDAFQRQRHAAALELAIRQPDKAMFEVRARGRLQRQLIARARGLAPQPP